MQETKFPAFVELAVWFDDVEALFPVDTGDWIRRRNVIHTRCGKGFAAETEGEEVRLFSIVLSFVPTQAGKTSFEIDGKISSLGKRWDETMIFPTGRFGDIKGVRLDTLISFCCEIIQAIFSM